MKHHNQFRTSTLSATETQGSANTYAKPSSAIQTAYRLLRHSAGYSVIEEVDATLRHPLYVGDKSFHVHVMPAGTYLPYIGTFIATVVRILMCSTLSTPFNRYHGSHNSLLCYCPFPWPPSATASHNRLSESVKKSYRSTPHWNRHDIRESESE